MKKSFLLIIFIFTAFLSGSSFLFAAQQNGSPIITEATLTLNINTDDSSVILEVYDQQNKKVAGPTTSTGTSPIKATINILNLSRGTTYTLKAKDKNASLGGDTFSLNFTTLKTDTRVSGSGDWYYTVGMILANYDTDRNKSLFVFNSESACNTARTQKIDDLYSAESVAGGGVKNSTITPCFQSKTVPTKKEFESKLQSIDGMSGSKSLFYFTYGYKTDTIFNRSSGYKTLQECERAQAIYANQVVMRCTASTSAPTEPTNWDSLLNGNVVDPQKDPTPFDSDYTLLAPVGKLTSIGDESENKIGDYLNIILMIAIGLCGALAVIMIVVRGVQYMGDESVFGKTEAKHHIMQAVLGLILALGAYAILNTINPNLVGGSLTFNSVEIELEATESIGSSKYQEITGLKLLPPSQYDSKIRQVAKTEGVPYCALRVTIQRESGSGGADRIGWDSNVRNKDIKARRDFIDSQKKYSGLTFTKKADSITDKSIMNDDKTITNTDSLGLDWRFSHGIGLTQITCQPQPGVTFETRNSLPKCPVGNYTPKQLLNPEINIEAAGKMWKQFTSSSACGGDVYKTFMAYAQGNSGCSSPSAWAKQTADAKMTLYKKCLAEQ